MNAKGGRLSLPPLSVIPKASRRRKKGDRGWDGNKKVKGRKRHLATDTDSNLLGCRVTPANVDDREGLKLVLNTFKVDAPFV
ncbi:transposase, partial [Deinococcus frigens]|uniref:transposase n=1 Tax=Deinococcus frigens TaxID=249403 RepID=UPI0039EFD4FF